jgi:hypothetical protein
MSSVHMDMVQPRKQTKSPGPGYEAGHGHGGSGGGRIASICYVRPSYTIPDSYRSDINLRCFAVLSALTAFHIWSFCLIMLYYHNFKGQIHLEAVKFDVSPMRIRYRVTANCAGPRFVKKSVEYCQLNWEITSCTPLQGVLIIMSWFAIG